MTRITSGVCDTYALQTPINLTQWRRRLWGTGVRAPSTYNSSIFSSLWSKSESQLSKYYVREIS